MILSYFRLFMVKHRTKRFSEFRLQYCKFAALNTLSSKKIHSEPILQIICLRQLYTFYTCLLRMSWLQKGPVSIEEITILPEEITILPEELNIRNVGTVMFTGGENIAKTKLIIFEPKTEHFGRSIVRYSFLQLLMMG